MCHDITEKLAVKAETTANEEEGGDDKTWEDADKDSSDIQAQPHANNEDEDEDSTTTIERYGIRRSGYAWTALKFQTFQFINWIVLFYRYDRFKNSDKTSDAEAEKIDESIEDIKKDDNKDEVQEWIYAWQTLQYQLIQSMYF